jgi:purine-binding chemotaxis protein CheW
MTSARISDHGADDVPAHSVVTVTIANQLFGIDITQVEDVFALQRVTPVPLAPPTVVGILNLRGRVVTALCLKRVLNVGSSPAGKRPMAVGMARGSELFGLIVDTVGDVIAVDPAKREAVPPHLKEKWARYALGIHKLDSGLLVELDAEKLTHIDAEALAA